MEDVDGLLAVASAETGLTEFGEGTFHEGLDLLVDSLLKEARLSAVGDFALRDIIVRLLKNRLQIEDWYHRYPEIDDEVILRPLIGLGLPRTGSTALAALLGEDPRARSLVQWQAEEPCPPPSTVPAPDPRIARAQAKAVLIRQLSPKLTSMQPSSPTGPFEDHDLMGLDFKSQIFQAFAQIPSYSAWLLDADLTSTYRYEHRVLKLLQWGQERQPWRLKCPTHLIYLGHLDQAFPDARFVMTHRDPTEVLVSVADVYATAAAMFSEEVDPRYLAALNVEQWAVGMRRALEFRDAGNEDRFFDLDFRAMRRDPVGEVRRLYAWLDEPVTPVFETGMRRWWHENAENREETVHPDPAAFGLDLDAVRPLFADYVTRSAEWTAPERSGH
ncbi:sulfotransferase [Pseudofrankia sp. DC12]|uniref:sulfotransferase family protein n=1 Tax=Pseudofrankia sp. DC12 TaxID=683315 RepID=UPI0005F7775D|nr:sulfotransferase [Pseudofrankia sp. DC12]